MRKENMQIAYNSTTVFQLYESAFEWSTDNYDQQKYTAVQCTLLRSFTPAIFVYHFSGYMKFDINTFSSS